MTAWLASRLAGQVVSFQPGFPSTMNRKTIRLVNQRFIGTHHLDPGSEVTLGDKEADRLIKEGHAVQIAFKEDAKIPEPKKLELIQTATVDPGPKKAARVTTRE